MQIKSTAFYTNSELQLSGNIYAREGREDLDNWITYYTHRNNQFDLLQFPIESEVMHSLLYP